jgi:hypothetical protein
MLVVWTITGDNRFDTILAQADERNELLEWLRHEFAEETPPLWSVSLELEPPECLPPEWCEEDSILGDFLRVVQKYELTADAALDLDAGMDGCLPTELSAVLSCTTEEDRRWLLKSAALLGADLLRGDEQSGH